MIDLFLVWWLRTGRYRWSRLYRRLFERHYLKTTLPAANSLEEVQACLGQVEWTADSALHLFDCVSYPQKTWAKKKDDCDGFAALAAELLNRWRSNLNPLLLTVILRPVRQSHTVCVFKDSDGNLCFFDNNVLRPEKLQSFEQVTSKVGERGKRTVCWDVREPFTFKMIEFHRA